MAKQFDYQGARKEGYSDEEITSFLSDQHPNFDFEEASNEGYSLEEINEFLSSHKPKKSKTEKATRLASQFGLGAAESALLPYEIGVMPLASKEAQNVPYREMLGDELEQLMEKKASGQWDERDQGLLEHISEQIKDPRKSMEFAQSGDLGVRGLAEKATGLDLHPEGALEHAANWAGFIKDPRKIAEIAKLGLNPKEIIKAIMPTGSEALASLGAGTALDLAEQGNFGPIGTMAAAVVGDLSGRGLAGIAKGASKVISRPKKALAEAAAKFTPKEKIKLQQEIIKDFREAGIQADLGSITNNNLMKWTQSRLAQSQLTGKALDDFRQELTGQIKREYKTLADALGEAKFATQHEAGTVAKEGLKQIRDADIAETRKLYENATKALKENAFVDSNRIAMAVEKLEKELKPGRIKSGEQSTVLNTLEKLKQDLYDSEGNLLYANVKDLMNNKIALNDIINYEVQGGAKQLLKGIVSELDRSIISHGKNNPTFAKNYINANKRFSEHAKKFRNKDISLILKSEDPTQLINKMNSVQGIRNLENVFKKTPEGKEIFNSVKRNKLDDVIEKKMIDSTTQQINLGTFSKLLEKGKNKEIIKEILGPESFKRLERLQKNAGKLADAAQKFYNTSQSATVAADAAVLAKGISDFASLLMGNPWPIVKTTTGIFGARKLSNLLSDPEFLKLAEDAILASEKGNQKDLINIFEKFRPYILESNQQIRGADEETAPHENINL